MQKEDSPLELPPLYHVTDSTTFPCRMSQLPPGVALDPR
jgi:hypothetical protein